MSFTVFVSSNFCPHSQMFVTASDWNIDSDGNHRYTYIAESNQKKNGKFNAWGFRRLLLNGICGDGRFLKYGDGFACDCGCGREIYELQEITNADMFTRYMDSMKNSENFGHGHFKDAPERQMNPPQKFSTAVRLDRFHASQEQKADPKYHLKRKREDDERWERFQKFHHPRDSIAESWSKEIDRYNVSQKEYCRLFCGKIYHHKHCPTVNVYGGVCGKCAEPVDAPKTCTFKELSNPVCHHGCLDGGQPSELCPLHNKPEELTEEQKNEVDFISDMLRDNEEVFNEIEEEFELDEHPEAEEFGY